MTRIWITELPEGMLYDVVNWCEEQFGPCSWGWVEAREQKNWSYTWEGWSSQKQWVVDICPAHWVTLFALRWSANISRTELR
jgi:hypothetical protein